MLIILLFTYKELEVLVKLLINLFSLSIGMWMLSSRGCNLDSEQVV